MTSNPETILKELSDSGELPGLYPATLDQLEPNFHSLLLLVRSSLTTALNQANANVTDGVVHPPFHLDYVDSPQPGAFAFQHRDCAFIIINIQMAELLLQLADTLSRAEPILNLLAIDRTRADLLRTVLFVVELNFLVCHEFTHHIHGHLPAPFGTGLPIWIEFGGIPTGGIRLEEQAQEAGADSYAVYIALHHLIAEGAPSICCKPVY